MTYRYCPENWSRLSALLDSAPDLPVDQQLSWIENLATESQEVKAQLRRLLAAAIPADKFLCKRPNFAAVMLDEAACFQQIEIELQPDRLIGAYRLIRELGVGGMGSVWLAQRVDGKFKRDVALKFPFAGPRQRQLVERLIREREILAGLQHANIARLYDADVTASGQPFLVLEYIDGVAINDYCDQHRLDIRARLLLFQQVLSAVRYAHAHLVIHRDIKPSNILITGDGVVHLLDFGIATFIADGTAHATPLTQFGGHVLTPEYASPEQVAGLTMTTASDVYALGVVLYELLTGSSPYRWQRDHRVQLEEAIANADVISPDRAIISNEITTSRNTQPRQLGKILRGEVNTLLLKALKKNVDARYASADEFYQDISRYLEHQPIHAQPDSQWYRIRKFTQRNHVIVASITAIMIAMITGTGLALWQAHVASQQARLAAQQRDRAVALAARGEAINEFMRLMVTEIAAVDEPITMHALLERSEAVAMKSFDENVDQQAAVLEVLGGYYLALNQTRLANRSFTQALKLTENSPDHATRARLHCNAGSSYSELGDSSLAIKHINIGLGLAAGSAEAQVTCLQARATYFGYNNDFESELKDLRMAQDELPNLQSDKLAAAAEILVNIADADLELGKIAQADQEYAMALKQVTKLGRGNEFMAMNIQSGWGYADSFSGNPRSALNHFDKAISIAHGHFPSKTNDASIYTIDRASQLYKLARYQESLQQFQLALAFSKNNHNEIGVMMSILGEARATLLQGDVVGAVQLLQQAKLELHGKQQASDSVMAQNFIYMNGLIQFARHQNADAVAQFTQNINYLTAHKQISTPLAYNFKSRGDAYLADNNLTVALADAAQSFEIAHSVQGELPYSSYSGESALLIAKIHYSKNKNDEANKWATIAYQQLQGSVGADHPNTLEAKHLLDSLQTMH